MCVHLSLISVNTYIENKDLNIEHFNTIYIYIYILYYYKILYLKFTGAFL